MPIRLVVIALGLAVAAAACGSDGEDDPDATTTVDQTTTSTGSSTTSEPSTPSTAGPTTSATPTITATPTSTDASDGAADQATTDESDDGAPVGFAVSLDDPVYLDLILDCWYGENEVGSCEELEAAGLTAEEAYGLGNSVSQAPNDAVRDDCVAGVGVGCAELNLRVQSAVNDGDTETLLCFFHGYLTGPTPDDIDAFYEGELLGVDAPPAVTDALFTLVEDPTSAELIATVDGYVGPICA